MGLAGGNYGRAGAHSRRDDALARNDSGSENKLTARSLSFRLNYVQHGRLLLTHDHQALPGERRLSCANRASLSFCQV
jgi:hypothetical protein